MAIRALYIVAFSHACVSIKLVIDRTAFLTFLRELSTLSACVRDGVTGVWSELR